MNTELVGASLATASNNLCDYIEVYYAAQAGRWWCLFLAGGLA
jgi:hypothetical protein